MTDVFEGLTTVAAINRAYKEAFEDQDCLNNRPNYWALSEAHRRTLEALAFGPKVVTETDPNHVNPLQVRNWARKQGIPLARKGRVSLDMANAYRRDHNLPIVKVEKPAKIVVDATPAEIRAWAREEGIEVAVKGRVHPDVVRAYAEAHPVVSDEGQE